jgi:hypothetical protein
LSFSTQNISGDENFIPNHNIGPPGRDHSGQPALLVVDGLALVLVLCLALLLVDRVALVLVLGLALGLVDGVTLASRKRKRNVENNASV